MSCIICDSRLIYIARERSCCSASRITARRIFLKSAKLNNSRRSCRKWSARNSLSRRKHIDASDAIIFKAAERERRKKCHKRAVKCLLISCARSVCGLSLSPPGQLTRLRLWTVHESSEISCSLTSSICFRFSRELSTKACNQTQSSFASLARRKLN